MDRVAIAVFSIAFACALLVGSAYAATWLAPYLSQVPAWWSMAMVAAGGMIAGAAAVWRKHVQASASNFAAGAGARSDVGK